MSAALLADRIGHFAAGTLRCQRYIDALRRGEAEPAEAIEELKQLTIEFGADSASIAGFMTELAKRAR